MLQRLLLHLPVLVHDHLPIRLLNHIEMALQLHPQLQIQWFQVQMLEPFLLKWRQLSLLYLLCFQLKFGLMVHFLLVGQVLIRLVGLIWEGEVFVWGTWRFKFLEGRGYLIPFEWALWAGLAVEGTLAVHSSVVLFVLRSLSYVLTLPRLSSSLHLVPNSRQDLLIMIQKVIAYRLLPSALFNSPARVPLRRAIEIKIGGNIIHLVGSDLLTVLDIIVYPRVGILSHKVVLILNKLFNPIIKLLLLHWYLLFYAMTFVKVLTVQSISFLCLQVVYLAFDVFEGLYCVF